jgi:uncharacterized membrane protein YesL
LDEKKKKKFNLFKLFSTHSDTEGVSREEEEKIATPNLATFFKLYKRKFGRLLSVNIFMVVGNFPLFFAIIALAGYFDYLLTTPSNPIFQIINGAAQFSESQSLSILLSFFGEQRTIMVPSIVTYILWGLSALFIFTFGWVNVGTTYILRSFVRGDPVFMWSDFWYAIKRNRRQGMIMGILDILFIGLIVYDLAFFYINLGQFYMNLMFYITLLVGVIYFAMRFYIYLLMITFDLKLTKILKNAFIFSILGFKRNFMATLGIIALLAVNMVLLIYFLPLGLTFPFVLLFSNGSFMTTYAAYYKIKEIMIDPYQEDSAEGAAEPEPEEI